ncbi:hypothetical protein NPX13_g10879 [Xylaria arbuscula]|uniref:IQ domain-containing protein IQM6 n=1 Tax=Xylaria arbuscula TaxID=114810 RepID=A0A9W8TH33_9PEZI|nr:hypothetical protein NPX13_g10879 [Xylaria arbuscula]
MVKSQKVVTKEHKTLPDCDTVIHPTSPSPASSPTGQTPPSPLSAAATTATAAESASEESASTPHQRYLDSLQPPSDEEFNRLCHVQEEREREHKERNNDLRRREKMTARKSMEARRDFMKSKVLSDDDDRSPSVTADDHHSSQSPARVSSTDDTSDSGVANKNEDPSSLSAKAAMVIQRSYRGYRVRREMQGLGLDASTRWTHAIRDAQWKEVTKPRPREEQPPVGAGTTDDDGEKRPSTSRSHALQNWKKAAAIARRAGGDEDSDHSASSDSSSSPNSEELARMDTATREAVRRKKEKAQAKRRKHARMMGLQYFLEMVDLKHRYGSNLRTYHREWQKSDTNENYFYWLDYGEGKNLDLPNCPRERLDRECVRYLNREERQHYLVKVDNEGRLVWAKNGIRIDTTEEWKDSIHGIVPADDPTPAFAPEVEKHAQARTHNKSDHPRQPQDRSTSSSSSSGNSSRENELEAARAAKYANADLDKAKGVKKIKHVSAATIFNRLLRKSVRKNTWIFVADTSFRLYVGIKASGAFQHSSFLQGARISAAGLIKIKNGRLSSLSPLSGHYRPPASNFRAFVHSLEDEGVDMSHVSISRSYAVLVGLEMYIKTQRKAKAAVNRVSVKKMKVFKPEEARRREEEAWDKSQSAAKERRVLEKEREIEERKREENKASVKIMQKLGLRPRTPSIQNDETRADKNQAIF